jgi:hypothetical protein
MNTEDFQTHVVDALARLDTKVTDLVGNGQPGRVSRLEEKVDTINRWRWVIAGVVLSLSALVHFIFRY